jgi:hypothetical protein
MMQQAQKEQKKGSLCFSFYNNLASSSLSSFCADRNAKQKQIHLNAQPSRRDRNGSHKGTDAMLSALSLVNNKVQEFDATNAKTLAELEHVTPESILSTSFDSYFDIMLHIERATTIH